MSQIQRLFRFPTHTQSITMSSIRFAFAFLTGCLFILPAHAQLFVEVDHVDLGTLDPTTNDGRLGRSIALADDGRVLLAAAPLQDDADSGVQDGVVYSFRVNPDGTLDFLQKIAPPARSRLGETLAADGAWAAMSESGPTVHLQRLSGASWTETQRLTLDDVVEPAGVDVRGLSSAAAMQGDLLAIGNTTAQVTTGGTTATNAGAVVLFRRGGDAVWRFEAVLVQPDPDDSSQFGSAIAVAGNTVVVGARNARVNTEIVGGAYVFERNGGNWSHAATLRNPDAENARFGWSVAVDGDLAIVGCATCLVLPDPGDPSNTGSFFAFERNLGGNDSWGLRGEFYGTNPAFIDNFSKSLRLRGRTLMVGASGSQEASFFVRATSGDWEEVARLPSGDSSNTAYGISVDFMGGKAQIGADSWPDDGMGSAPRRGAVSAWFGATVEACRGNFEGVFCDGFESVN